MKQKRSQTVSVIGGADGPTSIFLAGHTKQPLRFKIKSKINQCRSRSVQKKITADPHTLEELVIYAQNRYNFAETNSDERNYTEQKNCLKAALILQHKPELLGELAEIPKPDFSDEEAVRDFFVKLQDRDRLIADMPDPVISMDYHLYEFHIGEDTMELGIDFIWNRFDLSYSGNRKSMKQLRRIARDLYLYYGVTSDDIKNRTDRYLSLVATLTG